MEEPRRKLPPWLLGLLIAALVFVITLVLLDAFGYGDDPVIEGGLVTIRH